MTVRADGDWVRLEGECRVEEAETLANLLHRGGWRGVDVSQCRLAHGAIAQVLVAFAVPITAGGASPFVRDFLTPALIAAQVTSARQLDVETLEQQPEGGAHAPSSRRSVPR